MWKIIKTILITIAVLTAIALLLFREKIEPGTLIAGLATFFAAMKSRIFGVTKIENFIGDVVEEHSAKRNDWKALKEKYDADINALRARMEYQDYRTEHLLQTIRDLDEAEKMAVQDLYDLSEEDLGKRLGR